MNSPRQITLLIFSLFILAGFFSCKKKNSIQKGDPTVSTKTIDNEYIKNNLVNAADFDIKGDNQIIKRADLDRLFNYCINNNKVAYFPKGNYQLPKDYSFDFENNFFGLIGDGKGKTVFSTSANQSIKYAKKLNITKAIPADGVYQVDHLGQSHQDFIHHDLKRGDYLQIKKGTISKISLKQVINLGYVTDLDLNEKEPVLDGLYVVAINNQNWGGGVEHTTLPWAKAVRVTMGSVVEKKQGVWSRHYTSNGFIFKGDGYVEGVEFNDIAFFIFSPFGTSKEKQFQLKNSKFSNCSRVFSLETSGGDTGALVPGIRHKPGSGNTAFFGFSFDHFEISNCEFDNIHSSILWFTPYTRNWVIRDNLVRDCYNAIALFYYQISKSAEESNLHNTCLVENNTFINCRNYSKSFAIDKTLVRVQGKAKVINNKAYACNGIHFYLSGSDNYASQNYVEPYNEYFTGNTGPIFWCKARGLKGSTDIIEENIVIGGGKTNPVGIQKNANLIVRKNIFKMGSAFRFITNSFSDTLDQRLAYILKSPKKLGQLTDQSDQKITPNSRIYFSEHGRWQSVSQNISEAAIIWAPIQNNVYTINIEDNIIESDLLFKSSTTKFTLSKLRVTGNSVFHSGQLIQCDDVNDVIISDNPIVQLHGFTNEALNSKRSLLVENNTFQRSFLGQLRLSSEGPVVVKGNRFNTIPDFDDYADFNLVRARSPGAVYVNSVSDEITFTNNTISLNQSRNTGLVIQNARKATIVSNDFNCDISITNYKERIPIALENSEHLSSLLIEDNRIKIKDESQLQLLKFNFHKKSSIETVVVKNNEVNQKLIPVKLDGGKNCTINNLYIDKQSNTISKFDGKINRVIKE